MKLQSFLIYVFIIFLHSCSTPKKIQAPPVIGPPAPDTFIKPPVKKAPDPAVRIEKIKAKDPLAAFQVHGTQALEVLMKSTTGGLAGEIIARSMDSMATQIKNLVPDAMVDRIAEGITVSFEAAYDAANELKLSNEKLSVWDNADPAIVELASVFKAFPRTNILIESHMYSRNTTNSKIELAKQRAESLRKFLQKQDIDPARLSTRAYSKSARLSNKRSDTSDSKISFVITADEKLRASARRMADAL